MSDFQKDLKEKWNKLSLFGSKKPKGFKGHGQKLGTADAPKSAVANDRALRPATPLSAARQPAPPPRPHPREPEAPPPGRKLGFSNADASSSGGTSERTGSGADAPAQPVPDSHRSSAAVESGVQAPPTAATAAEPSFWSSGYGAAQDGPGSPSDELQSAASMLYGEAQGVKSAALLSRVLGNIISKPSEEKYRKLRLSNKKVQDDLVNVTGGLEFLQAAGFQLVFDEADGYAVFPEGEDVEQLQSALRALDHRFQPHQPQSPAANPPIQWSDSAGASADSQATASRADATASDQQQQEQQPRRAAGPTSAAAAKPRDRQTQVLLPENPAMDVSDEVFRRTPAEVKAAYLAARRKQELGQMLMTRETRAKLAAGGAKARAPTHAVIRVRLPDGLVLQGEFNGGEPVSRVFEWVSDSLRDPSRIYELITPARRPLVTSAGSVRQADLLPSSLLNFRWLDHGGPDAGLPVLRDSLLAEARPSVG